MDNSEVQSCTKEVSCITCGIKYYEMNEIIRISDHHICYRCSIDIDEPISTNTTPLINNLLSYFGY
jgi:hypothetical protein